MTNTQQVLQNKLENQRFAFDLFNRSGSAEPNPVNVHLRFDITTSDFILVVDNIDAETGSDWKALCDRADEIYAMNKADLDEFRKSISQ